LKIMFMDDQDNVINIRYLEQNKFNISYQIIQDN